MNREGNNPAPAPRRESDRNIAGQQNQATSFGQLGRFGYVESNIVKSQGATGYVQVNSLTTTERNALTAVNGMVIYNETDSKLQAYVGGAWTNLH